MRGTCEQFPRKRVDPPLIVAKIGRTNEIAWRVAQLSAGFPPTSSLSWTVLDIVSFDSDTAVAQELSIGGEFVIAPETRLVQLLWELQNRAMERT